MTDATLTADLASLRTQLNVLGPGEAEWDSARLGWNLAHDQRPLAVAFPESVDDVVAVVDFARERGVRVAPQATGHFAGTLASLEGSILLKTERMRGVEIDPQTGRARVEAGAGVRSPSRRPTTARSEPSMPPSPISPSASR
jgi:FAD/FMN-containing dehydrogenase